MKKFSFVFIRIVTTHSPWQTSFACVFFSFFFFDHSADLVTIIILVLEHSLFPVAQRGESFKYRHVNYIKVESIYQYM